MSEIKEMAAVAAQVSRGSLVDEVFAQVMGKNELEAFTKGQAELAERPAGEIMDDLKAAMGAIGDAGSYMSQSGCDVVHSLGGALLPLWQACRISYQVLGACKNGECAADEAMRHIGVATCSVYDSAKRFERLQEKLMAGHTGHDKECPGGDLG